MPSTVLSLSSLIFSIALLVCGNAFLATLLGLRLSIEQVSPLMIGAIMVCYCFGFVAGSLYASNVVVRVGHIRAFAVFAAILSVVILLHALWVSPELWALLRAVAGFTTAGLMIVVESWFSSSSTKSNRSGLFAIYQVVFFVATAIGQLLIRLKEPTNFVPFTLAAILVILALIPLSMTRQNSPAIDSGGRMSLMDLYRRAPTGLMGAVVCGLLISSFYTMGPAFANQVGFDTAQVSNFMAAAIGGAMLLAWPIGRLCDFIDRYAVMLVAALTAALISVIIAMIGIRHPLTLAALIALYMGLSSVLYPIAVAIANDLMDNSEITAASTALLLSYGIGSCIGPLASALSMEILGPQGFFVTGATALLVLTVFMRFGPGRTRSPIPGVYQENYVTTTPEANLAMTDMDPRYQTPEAEPPAHPQTPL